MWHLSLDYSCRCSLRLYRYCRVLNKVKLKLTVNNFLQRSGIPISKNYLTTSIIIKSTTTYPTTTDRYRHRYRSGTGHLIDR